MFHNGRYVVHKLVVFCSREFVWPGSTPAFQFPGSFLLAGCFRKKQNTGISFPVCSSSGKICQDNTGNIFFSPTIMFGYSAANTHLCPSRTITGKFVVLKYIAVGANGYIISPTKTQQVGTNNWNAVAYGNGKYVAVGDYRGTATSTNGVNWTVKEFGAGVPTGINTHWNGVTYSNGKFVMVGYRENDLSYIATSTDGINWTANAVGNKYIHWQSVVYGNGKFVVLGNDCSFGYSSDGTNWEYKYYGISSSPTEYRSVTYGNGKYVAVGRLGKITTSNDGINWTTPINVDLSSFDSVTFGSGKFVAVGYGYRGSAAYSTDGINWTVTGKDVMINRAFYSVAYSADNKMFVAAGGDGYVTYSSDGANWSVPEQVKDGSGNTFTTDLRAVYMLP